MNFPKKKHVDGGVNAKKKNTFAKKSVSSKRRQDRQMQADEKRRKRIHAQSHDRQTDRSDEKRQPRQPGRSLKTGVLHHSQKSLRGDKRIERKDAHSRFPLKHRYQGTIRITGKGVGYVSVPEIKDEDIEIDPAFLHTALDNDQVEIVLHSKIVGIRQGGEVTKVLLRSKTRFVGILTREEGTYFCIPDDVRMYRPILIPKQHVGEAKPGDKVFVELKKWTDSMQDPLGEVVKVIGKAGAHDTEMESIVLERGFDITFPPDVTKAAEQIPTEIDAATIASRRDFRSVLTMTIDPKDAKDFDDALSWKKLPNGNIEVGVHIADVTHYVTPKSRLDQEAAERGPQSRYA
jgi:ribonuclease R/exosome complex exonuclease DIS3/RRP44